MHCPHQATPTSNDWLATPIPSIRQPEPNLHRMLGEEPRRLKKKTSTKCAPWMHARATLAVRRGA